MKIIGLIACALVVVGGLNWGLVGFFRYDLVAAIFGDMTTSARVIYGLVGVAAVAHLLTCKKSCCKAQ